MARPRRKDLRELLEDRGLKVADLMDAFPPENRPSRAAVNFWVSGTNRPRMERLAPIARFLGITVDDLREALDETGRRQTAG